MLSADAATFGDEDDDGEEEQENEEIIEEEERSKDKWWCNLRQLHTLLQWWILHLHLLDILFYIWLPNHLFWVRLTTYSMAHQSSPFGSASPYMAPQASPFGVCFIIYDSSIISSSIPNYLYEWWILSLRDSWCSLRFSCQMRILMSLHLIPGTRVNLRNNFIE